MRFLMVTAVMFVESAVDVYQMVGDKVQRSHVSILGLLAVRIHARNIQEFSKVTERKE